jgi:hypothetical protein
MIGNLSLSSLQSFGSLFGFLPRRSYGSRTQAGVDLADLVRPARAADPADRLGESGADQHSRDCHAWGTRRH